MKETEIRAAINDMAPETLADALAVLLARGESPRQPVAGTERPELANFAQAILYLKKNYDFEELDMFSTEADLVYVQTADRRILLTDKSRTMQLSAETAGKPSGVSAVSGVSGDSSKSGDSGRFSNLEI